MQLFMTLSPINFVSEYFPFTIFYITMYIIIHYIFIYTIKLLIQNLLLIYSGITYWCNFLKIKFLNILVLWKLCILIFFFRHKYIVRVNFNCVCNVNMLILFFFYKRTQGFLTKKVKITKKGIKI